MKSQKLAIFIADNDIKKRHLCEELKVSNSQMSRWLNAGNMYVVSDYYGNHDLVKKVKSFKF